MSTETMKGGRPLLFEEGIEEGKDEEGREEEGREGSDLTRRGTRVEMRTIATTARDERTIRRTGGFFFW